jgi:enoyl-CoA hydratase
VDYQTLGFTFDGAAARIVLTRPERANRIDARALEELADVCERIAGLAEVRVAVLTADGDVFSTGWGDDVLATPPATDPFGCIAALAVPVVAAVNGDAFSAGLELALACDLRIAADTARFAMPETELGMMPRGGASQRLPRAAGRGRALAMLLASDVLDAEGALRDGLVSRVVPRGRLAAETDALVTTLTKRGPLALRYAKEAVQRGVDLTLDQALRYETDLTIILQTTEDRAEGVNAFLEKRDPRFEGR